jgi:hypothetical protein
VRGRRDLLKYVSPSGIHHDVVAACRASSAPAAECGVMEGLREQEREEVDELSTRAASWLAWPMWALSMVLTVLSLWLLVPGLARPNVLVYPYWAEGTLLAVAYSTVGAVVASRRPRNLVGWVLCSIGLSWGRIISAASMLPTRY